MGLTQSSCLTGLPIMGAILNRQGDTNFMGLQLFAGISCLLGATLLTISTYLQGKSRGTWRV